MWRCARSGHCCAHITPHCSRRAGASGPVRNPLDDCGLMVQHVCMVPRHIGTCRISVDTHANSPTRQIPSCTCSVRAHPARVMHAACDGSGWVPTSPRLSRPARGSPHSHAPHHGSRPRRTRGRDAPAVLPPPPRPAGPPRSPIASALKGARGNGSRPPMHARR